MGYANMFILMDNTNLNDRTKTIYKLHFGLVGVVYGFARFRRAFARQSKHNFGFPGAKLILRPKRNDSGTIIAQASETVEAAHKASVINVKMQSSIKDELL